jgi:hypothetical protein
MDLDRLYQILAETTVQLRKGAVYEGTPELVAQAEAGEDLTGGGVLEIFDMPHADEARPDLVKVDLEFLIVGVDAAKAKSRKTEVVDILNRYPAPERLARGPSYIEVGAEIGDQGAAFQLFALGKVLGLWDVITPAAFGMTGAKAREMAGAGFVMITGFRAAALAAEAAE